MTSRDRSSSKPPPRVSLCGLISVAGVACAVGTLFGFLGPFYWFFDLFSHLRVQYALGLAVAGGVALFRKEFQMGTGFTGLAMLNAVLLVPQLVAESRPEINPISVMFRAVLINVNTRSGDPVRVGAFITEADPDVLILEEVNENWLVELGVALAPFPYAVERPREDNFGIALYSKFPLVGEEIRFIGQDEVPSIIADAETPGGCCTIVATHTVPPAGPKRSAMRNAHLKRLAEEVKKEIYPLLVMGDLNTTPWSVHFRRLRERTGLHDSSRGHGLSPTWPTYNPLLMIPIDHCFHSDEITIIGRSVGPRVGSDHFPLTVDIALGPDTTAGSSLR